MTEPRQFDHCSQVYYQTVETLLEPPESVRMSFWPKFDSLIGGLRRNEYSILCGSTGAGKTSFLASMVEGVTKLGVKTFVANVETGPVDFFRRIISARAKKNLNEGEPISVDYFAHIEATNRDLSELPLWLARYENRVSSAEMMDQVRIAIREHDVMLVVIDNLNFVMEVTSQSQSVVEMDRVVHDWVMFAKENPVHVIMVMHPKKGDRGGNRVESEFDIKGSSTAVQEAHNVWLFNRHPEEDVTNGFLDPFGREIKIAKCRRIGRGVGKSVKFRSTDFGASYEEYEHYSRGGQRPYAARGNG